MKMMQKSLQELTFEKHTAVFCGQISTTETHKTSEHGKVLGKDAGIAARLS